mgnify:CR=1 FL=1
MEEKDTNPKDSVGVAKAPMSVLSAPVLLEEGLVMMGGDRKYGRHNFRGVGVKASVYYDAFMRHVMAWWEGEDLDPESGLHHLAHARASLGVIRDAEIRGNWGDDRPPKTDFNWVGEANILAEEVIEKYPESKEPYTQLKVKLEKVADEDDGYELGGPCDVSPEVHD